MVSQYDKGLGRSLSLLSATLESTMKEMTDFTFETRFGRLRKIVLWGPPLFSNRTLFSGRIFQIDLQNGQKSGWKPKNPNFQKGPKRPVLALFDTFWPNFDPVGSETENFEKIYQNFSKIDNFENFEKFGKKIENLAKNRKFSKFQKNRKISKKSKIKKKLRKK